MKTLQSLQCVRNIISDEFAHSYILLYYRINSKKEKYAGFLIFFYWPRLVGKMSGYMANDPFVDGS